MVVKACFLKKDPCVLYEPQPFTELLCFLLLGFLGYTGHGMETVEKAKESINKKNPTD